MKKYIRNQCTIDNAQLTMIAALIMLTSLLACTADSDSELSTSTSLAITITQPPAWQAGVDTRHTITTDNKVEWEDGDILYGTITFHHKSGLVDEPVPFELKLNTSEFVDPAPTWPVGQDISHATLQGLYGYTNANATTRVTGNPPIYHATAKAKPGEALNLSFTHRTAAVYIKNTNAAPITFEVDGLTAITVNSGANATLYPIIAADAKEITGTVTLNDGTILPFAIATGQEGPIGKIHTVADGATPGGENPGEITEYGKIKKATDDFVAWAQAYIAGTKSNYKLTYHVDLTGIDWAPIGGYEVGAAFTHVFDGAGYTIKGLKINKPMKDYQALFGYTRYATIKNVHIVDCEITGDNFTSALVGKIEYGTITNCSVTGTVNGAIYTGGMVGYSNGGTITACYATGTVTGTSNTGGLVGYNTGNINVITGTITACYATGDVTGTDSYTGGLVGANDTSNITACYATGAVTGTGSHTGALVGSNNAGTITYSHAVPGGTVTRFVGNVASNPAAGDANGNSVQDGAAGTTVRAWDGTVTIDRNSYTGSTIWNTEEPPKLYWE
ncbi:hypothetical protein LJC05_00795 [Bacteroides sp. OttesenSCG-928-J23]|nr:hypothetical protein [Bacteroides sp. OttesenSCG-928-J23]